jgi:type I restriction enzyme, S subunit
VRWPRYAQMKASGVAWLGDVPGHWDMKRLKFASELINDKVERLPADSSYVGLENVESETGRWVDSESEPGSESQSLLFARDDVLFGKLRPYLAKSFLATSDGCCSSEFMVLRGRSLFPTYLRYWCASNHFVSVVNGSTYGSKMPRADPAFIASLLCTAPPLDEQRAIATFLDRETARIDALVAAKRRLIALLQEKRAALIARAVTRGLDPDVPTKDSGVAWLGRVPVHWDVRRVKLVAKLESGHTPSKQVAEYWEDCDIPWVSLNDSRQLAAVDYISETAIQINSRGLANSSARLLPPGAVVFTRDATIGLASITTRDMAVSQHLIAWLPTAKITSLFLLRVFNAMRPFLESFTFGATIKTIGMSDVKKLVTPVPPLEEQAAITEFIARETSRLDAVKSCVEAAIDRLIEYRSTLITSAVTGRIDVRAAA